MLQNVFYTAIKGSNIVFLNIPEVDYFSMYDSLTKEFAEDIVQRYFTMRGKEEILRLREMEIDSQTHNINLMLELDNTMLSKEGIVQ
ncbi:hypothetical protein P8V03_01515 [Clostridium sp. A1-XYC3]|uniref:Uncharacterized protein n=1 Tax=Clostridium tanneri TaxID=3037988 RepID=A0ABU4JNX9_9CLOT|nr:hypothetical protein [Clostridium sp. A1-XYC3]MDW8799830.1 hypothetical protein [Clostridium sp. A1-XYC3]